MFRSSGVTKFCLGVPGSGFAIRHFRLRALALVTRGHYDLFPFCPRSRADFGISAVGTRNAIGMILGTPFVAQHVLPDRATR